MNRTENLFGEEDDDDDDSSSEEEETKAEPVAVTGTATGTGTGTGTGIRPEKQRDDSDEHNIDDSDDNDDDEHGFEAENLVSGTSLPNRLRKAKHKNSADDAALTTTTTTNTNTNADSTKVSRRTLSVLDIPPPLLSNSSSSSSSSSSSKRKKSSLHVTKLPNLLNVNTEPYDKDTYDPEEEEKEYRGYVHNMIRWRYVQDPDTGDYVRDEHGKLKRESNSRIIKWSDGSWTLHVGEEAFDISQAGTANPASATAASGGGVAVGNTAGYLYLTQKATAVSNSDDNDNDDNERVGTILECVGALQSKLVPRPSITSQAHKNLTMAVKSSSIKGTKIQEYVTQVDPEKARDVRIKNKDDLLRVHKHNKKGGRGANGRKFYTNHPDEGSGRYDTTNIRDLKADRRDRYDDDDDDNYNSNKWSARRRGHKRKTQYSEYDEEEEDDDDDDDEDMGGVGDDESESDEDLNFNRKRKKRANVLDDDD